MTVDWLTVAAQVVNFLVLVYLLKRFLYGPVVRAMSRRDEAMAERLQAVERREAEAETEARRHREAREALDVQRERLLVRAREEAHDVRRALEKEVQREIEQTRASWRAELEREQAAFLRDVRRQVTEQFETLARRALADLASAELEAQMARVLSERLESLDDECRSALVRAAASGEPIRVRSAFELPAPAKRTLTSAVRGTVGDDVEVVYERAEDVICGVELRAGGQSLTWSLEGYLDGLERRLADGLSRHPPGRQDEGTR